MPFGEPFTRPRIRIGVPISGMVNVQRSSRPATDRSRWGDRTSPIRENDVAFLAARTNPYLLRYYFFSAGMKDDEFMQRLRDG